MTRKEAMEWSKVAEKLCANYLRSKGYCVREQNWRPKGASGSRLEIDIVAEKDTEIVFVEVKARSPEGDDPFLAIDDAKIRNLTRAADSYLRMQEHDHPWRFDVIGVVGTCAEDARIEHVEDAFLPPLFNK